MYKACITNKLTGTGILTTLLTSWIQYTDILFLAKCNDNLKYATVSHIWSCRDSVMENDTFNHTSTISRKQASTLVITHHQLSTNSTQIGRVVHQLHKALPRTNTSFNVMRGLHLQCIQIPRSTYTLANYWNIHAFLSTTTIVEHSHTYHTTFHPPFTHKTHPEIASTC